MSNIPQAVRDKLHNHVDKINEMQNKCASIKWQLLSLKDDVSTMDSSKTRLLRTAIDNILKEFE